MSNKKTIIGIDPGKSGGIALLANNRITAVKMPLNVIELQTYLKTIISTYENPLVFIEKVQSYSVGDDAPGKKFGINKMLANYAELLTVIKLLKIPFIEVYPVSWQSTLGLRLKKPKEITAVKFKSVRKKSYKEFAEKCFPEIKKVTLSTSDALCLVQFALHKNLHDPKWIKEKTQGGFVPGLFN